MNKPFEEIIPEPFNRFHLDVGNGHRIYVEESGKPDGVPIINFHGGPGSQSKPHHRSRFDQDRFRVILFDQRMGGQSTPHAVDAPQALRDFTPQNMILDAEAIRRHLKIERWHVAGSSWGSALAVLYGVTFPQAVESLTVRAFFTAQAAEWQWMAQAARLFAPAAFHAASALVNETDSARIAEILAQRILEAARENPQNVTGAVLPLAQALFAMEYGIEVLTEKPCDDEENAPACDKGNTAGPEPQPDHDHAGSVNSALLYAHIMTQHPLPQGWAVSPDAVSALKDIPIRIVHGACDILCPMHHVHAFQQAHRHATVQVASNAGHGVDLDGAYKALYRAALEEVLHKAGKT